MEIDIGYRPAHSMATIRLVDGESVMAEAGAMVGMSNNIHIQTQAGGVMKGIKRLFAGESFFCNTFTAQGAPGEVLVAHSLCGDMACLDMTSAGYFITSSCYIASSPNVEINTRLGGLKSFFGGEGLFVMQATSAGPGQVLLGAFGGIQEIPCDGNIVIDTGHLVAWDASLTYQVGKSGSGWVASFLSGEGLVCTFTGQGRIWIQTRNPVEYGRTVGPRLRPRKQ